MESSPTARATGVSTTAPTAKPIVVVGTPAGTRDEVRTTAAYATAQPSAVSAPSTTASPPSPVADTPTSSTRPTRATASAAQVVVSGRPWPSRLPPTAMSSGAAPRATRVAIETPAVPTARK
ncbi:hypothetical protein ASG36_06975 [Geodermatophilus sp. Leaf369]|nr:hypothetical protein ASG36_06975 [Geodermatophilus sp. Leaf369]